MSKIAAIAPGAVIFVTPYTIPSDWSERSALTCADPSLTVQADRDSSDINFIVKQFGLTGKLPYGVQVPEFADYSDIPNDYQQAVQFVDELDGAFLEMPAAVRARFENNPGLFLDFVSNPSNRDEATSLGLIVPKVEPKAETAAPAVSVEG